MSDWLVQDWLPLRHKLQLTAPEGGFKTMWNGYLSVCIAGGFSVLGHRTKQGSVFILDEETPKASLENLLDRFAQGFGLKSYRELPIKVSSMGGFRFGRKVSRERLLRNIDKESPILIPMDSLIAMLPGGRERLAENDSNIGEAIRDDLNAIVSTRPCSVLLTTHTKKSISDLSVDELRSSSMQNLVRGHGSIVGEGCDTGFVIKKLSEHPQPTRFAIITKARRQAIPMSSRVVFVELEEESYGRGYARLKEIPPEAIPPSKFAKTLFPLFLDKQEHKSRQIVYQLAFFKPRECLVGVEELLEHRAILNGSKPQVYRLNLKYKRDIHPDYLAALEAK